MKKNKEQILTIAGPIIVGIIIGIFCASVLS
jgi:hypothetical protein